ncbi:MAG: asnA [Clostridiales bacterium]|nr:asnA [Clostridiales bacterium]
MDNLIIPENYITELTIRETEVAIKKIKDFFEIELSKQLNLTRVTAPLFVKPKTGLNDNLNGIERPVSFGIKEQNEEVAEVVHSLAKWKRQALKRYEFSIGEGLYTDMSAIRRDEITDNLHSLYVDQWDWEKIIARTDRNEDTLKLTVRSIYRAIRNTEQYVAELYNYINVELPDEIEFVSTQQLEDMYPNLTPKQREYEITKLHGAVFLTQIGGALNSGEIHDGRAPDYDDWKLNGDILVYYSVLDCALELSSMGIRVDELALKRQLEISNCLDRAELPFQKSLLNGELPYTIGGGIGQSRLCMYYLRKAHVGEVQSSIWPDDIVEECKKSNINLL